MWTTKKREEEQEDEKEMHMLKENDERLRRKWKRIKRKENLEEEETENR